jgi:hypothetical protein
MTTNSFTPVALAVWKRGRWCVVAKVSTFIGSHEPILAVAWRNQCGTEAAVSLPVDVIKYAERAGVVNFYLRNDKTMEMLTCPLATFNRGRLAGDGERYVPIGWLRSVSWRDWKFAAQVVHITGLPEMGGEKTEQLALKF